MAHSSKLVGAFVKAIFIIALSVWPMMWAGRTRMLTRARSCVAANTTLIDGVDLASPAIAVLSRPVTSSRLLLPRSGLERSDFVLWSKAAIAAIHPTRKLSRDKLPSMRCA